MVDPGTGQERQGQKRFSRSNFCDLMECSGIRYLSSMTKAAKKRGGRGRPLKSETPMRQIAIRLPEAMLAAIDQFAVGRLDEPDRTAIMRELLAEAIAARTKTRK